MIDETVYEIGDREIFRCFLERHGKWRDISFLIGDFSERKCWKKIEQFILRQGIDFFQLDGFDLFCKCPFEEVFVAICCDVDSFSVKIQIVGEVYLPQKLKENVKIGSIDDEYRCFLDLTYVVHDFCRDFVFRECLIFGDEDLLEECFLLVEILLES